MSKEQGEILTTERYPFIAVVGAPGSGKSSLIEAFVEETKIKFVREPYQENPYLEGFYTEDSKKYAFNSQMFFLPNRGLEMVNARPLLTTESLMQDSTIDADEVMAKALRDMWLISDRDYMVYIRTKRKIEKGLLKPDILAYMKVGKEEVVERIIKRGRGMELKKMKRDPDYFPKLVDAFDNWYEEQKDKRKGFILFDTNKFDLINGPDSKAKAVRECCNWLSYYLSASHDRGLNGIGSDGARLIIPDFLRPPARDYSQFPSDSLRLDGT